MASSIPLGKLLLPRSLVPTKTLTKSQYLRNSMSDSISNIPNSQNAPPNLQNYPTPLSPPLPAISKGIELSRAMTSSSKSGLFVISRADFIHEDEWLIAVNKPQGVYCESVFDSVRTALSDSAQPGKEEIPALELHLANRLDRDTSGVMLITKSHKVAAKLVQAFTAHKVSKSYIALCVGPVPKWRKITVRSGHGRSRFGAWRVYAMSDAGRTLPGGSVVREMETSFELISINGRQFERSEEEEEESFVVVEERAVVDRGGEREEVMVRARPRSGRSHQIRLHCQYLGISICGDVKYEGVTEWRGLTFDGHRLHAESLTFEHPVTGLTVVFRAPLPSWASQGACNVELLIRTQIIYKLKSKS